MGGDWSGEALEPDAALLLLELLCCGVQVLLRKGVDLQALDNPVGAPVADNGEGIDEALRDTVAPVCCDAHGHGLAARADQPVVSVVRDGIGGGHGAGALAGVDHGGTPLLDPGNEGLLHPSLVADGGGDGGDEAVLRVVLQHAVVEVRVLGGGVITPDVDALDRVDRDVELGGDLGAGAVLVKAGEGGEVLLGDARGVGLGDEAVGIGGIANDQDLDIFGGELVKGLALGNKDLGILQQQVLPLHSLKPGHGSHQQRDINVPIVVEK